MLKLKLTQIGNSVGIVLPREVLRKLNAEKGDELFLIEGSEGYMISPYIEHFEEQIDSAARTMKQYRNALHELAK